MLSYGDLLVCAVYSAHLQLSMPLPDGELVYDYRLDDGGISRFGKDHEEEEEDKKGKFKVRVGYIYTCT